MYIQVLGAQLALQLPVKKSIVATIGTCDGTRPRSYARRTIGFRLRRPTSGMATTFQAKGAGLRLTA